MICQPAADGNDALVRMHDVVKLFPARGAIVFAEVSATTLHTVDGVSLDVRRGETLGLVGETGCGKIYRWLGVLCECIALRRDV